MPARSRSRESEPVTGTGRVALGVPYSVDKYGYMEGMSDFVGQPTVDHALDHTKSQTVGSLITTSKGDGSFLKDVPSALYGGLNLTDANPSTQSLVNKLLARTGPLTPKLRVPVSLFELRDLPKMLKHAGDLFLIEKGFLRRRNRQIALAPDKEAASAYLAYQFGWAPIVSDILKLIQVGEAVASTRANLERASSDKGLRRSVKLYESDTVSTSPMVMYSGGTFNITHPSVRVQTVARAWGTIRWKIKPYPQNVRLPGLEPPGFDPFKTALGLNMGQQLANVWKALPWSWMIDWFSNLSDRLDAAYNMTYFTASSLCLMRETKRTYIHEEWPKQNPVITQGEATRLKQMRFVDSTPSSKSTFELPILDSFKSSILASLTIVGIRGKVSGRMGPLGGRPPAHSST